MNLHVDPVGPGFPFNVEWNTRVHLQGSLVLVGIENSLRSSQTFPETPTLIDQSLLRRDFRPLRRVKDSPGLCTIKGDTEVGLSKTNHCFIQNGFVNTISSSGLLSNVCLCVTRLSNPFNLLSSQGTLTD